MAEIKDGSTHFWTLLGRTKIMGRCASSHFNSVATLNNYSNVINQTLLRPLNIQLAFLDLVLCFQIFF
jgi:hypothetical protein